MKPNHSKTLLALALVFGLTAFASASYAAQPPQDSEANAAQAPEAVPAQGGGVAFPASYCVPDGGWDDTLSQNSCCSGYAEPGTTVCFNPSDYGTTWASCVQVCGTRPVSGCVPSGGIDDTLSINHCCSGAAVPGSTHCLNPVDYGTTWKSCVQTCA